MWQPWCFHIFTPDFYLMIVQHILYPVCMLLGMWALSTTDWAILVSQITPLTYPAIPDHITDLSWYPRSHHWPTLLSQITPLTYPAIPDHTTDLSCYPRSHHWPILVSQITPLTYPGIPYHTTNLPCYPRSHTPLTYPGIPDHTTDLSWYPRSHHWPTRYPRSHHWPILLSQITPLTYPVIPQCPTTELSHYHIMLYHWAISLSHNALPHKATPTIP